MIRTLNFSYGGMTLRLRPRWHDFGSRVTLCTYIASSPSHSQLFNVECVFQHSTLKSWEWPGDEALKILLHVYQGQSSRNLQKPHLSPYKLCNWYVVINNLMTTLFSCTIMIIVLYFAKRRLDSLVFCITLAIMFHFAAFGVLLWELNTNGMSPYPGVESSELYERLEAGYRLPHPEGCPPVIYDLMRQCWEWTSENRPSFKDILDQFEGINKDIS